MDVLHRVPARPSSASIAEAPPRLWVGLALVAISWWVAWFDPINALLGNPSITAHVRVGRWDSVLVLVAAGLTRGWFWEMWNVLSMPKWVYGPTQGRRGRDA